MADLLGRLGDLLGLDYIRRNSMLTILRRHYPQLDPSLAGVKSAFEPWTRTAGPADLAR
jgi:hypothetical protein